MASFRRCALRGRERARAINRPGDTEEWSDEAAAIKGGQGMRGGRGEGGGNRRSSHDGVIYVL